MPLCLIIVSWSAAQDSLSTLEITSQPQGAQIYLDGVLSGSTPNILNRVLTGDHTIKVVREGYEDWITVMSVDQIDIYNVNAILNPLRGQIQFNSDILNAYIYIDGKLVGQTPKLVREIEYGWHFIEVRKTKKENDITDHSVYMDTVAVYDPNVILINANLKKEIDINNLNPLAVYLFNGNANDESGNGNHGIVYGATITEDRFGNPNKAYFFDGIDDYIEIKNNPVLKPHFPVSISAWVKPKSYNEPIGLFRNCAHETKYFGLYFLISTSGRVAMGYGNGGSIGPNSRRSKGGTTILNLGTWYHVVAVFKNSTEFEIFIDGKKDEGNYSGRANYMQYNSNSEEIGTIDSRSKYPPYYANAVVDNIYLFDRVLNEEEILVLYNESN